MKLAHSLRRSITFLAIVIIMAVTFQAVAQDEPGYSPEFIPRHGDQVTLGGDITVHSNERQAGSIVNIGGTVRIDGIVGGDVVVIGGDIVISGEVGGGVVAVMSDINLEDDALLRHGLINVLGDLEDAGADVRGEFFNLDLGMKLPGIGAPLSALVFIMFWWKLIKLALVFVGIIIMAALVPERVGRLSEEIDRRPVLSFFSGFAFCILGVPLITIMLFVSVVGIPLLPFAAMVWMVLKWLGLAGVFHFFGRRFGKMFGRNMSLFGAMLLGFLFCGLISLIPIVGWIFWTLITWLGIGLLFTARMGSAPLQSGAIHAPVAVPHAAVAAPAQTVEAEPVETSDDDTRTDKGPGRD